MAKRYTKYTELHVQPSERNFGPKGPGGVPTGASRSSIASHGGMGLIKRLPDLFDPVELELRKDRSELKRGR